MKDTKKAIIIILVIAILFIALIINLYFLFKTNSNNPSNFLNDFRNKAYTEGDANKNRGSNEKKYELKKMYPNDEADQRSDFQNFYDKLQGAIANENFEFILENLDDGIIFRYEIDKNNEEVYHTGQRGFEKEWRLDNGSIDEFLWEELERITLSGGIFLDDEKTIFELPYFRRELIDIEEDLNSKLSPNSEYVMVAVPIEKSVNVYREPDINSKVIEVLDYDVVIINDDGFEQKIDDSIYFFYKISTPTGKDGYVEDIQMNTTYDYHLKIENKANKWRITEFYFDGE